MKKSLLIAALLALSPFTASATALQCNENEVLVPAVTHTEEVTSCEFKGSWTFGLNSQCEGQWQFRQNAYHEVTEEIEIVDEPAYCQAVEEPVDACPNVNGIQEEGPCADTLCEAPETWQNDAQACVAPEVDEEDTEEPESVPETKSKGSTLKGGGGLCQPHPDRPECNQPANYAYHGMTYEGSANTQQLIARCWQLIGMLQQKIAELQ